MSTTRSVITTLTYTVGQAGNLLSVQQMISYLMALVWGGGGGKTKPISGMCTVSLNC